MSFLDDFLGNNPVASFTIYTNEALQPADDADLSDYEAINFSAMRDFQYSQQNNIATQPLENGEFSQDSIEGSSYHIMITAIYSPTYVAGYSNADMRADCGNVLKQLEEYKNNSTLLTLLQTRPLFRSYDSVKLFKYTHELTSNNQILVAHLDFLQIRITDTTLNGGINGNQVDNPDYSSSKDNGIQQPKAPTSGNVLRNAQ